MAPRRPDPGLARRVDQMLRGFARIGAVAVAGAGFVLRSRTGRRALTAANRRLAAVTGGPARRHTAFDRAALRAAELADSPALNRLADRASAGLDRLVKRVLR